MRLDTPDSLKNLTTQTLWWCGLVAFYPASRRLGGKKVETNDAFPWLPLFSSSAVSRPGIRWGNTEAATSVSICSAGCCGVFGFALTAMTRQLGNGDPRRTVPGLWGTSRRVIGWVLTDSSGRQPVPGKEQCSPGISPVPCSAARSLLSLSPRGGPLTIRSGTPGPSHDVSPWWTYEWPDDMVSQNTRDWCLSGNILYRASHEFPGISYIGQM